MVEGVTIILSALAQLAMISGVSAHLLVNQAPTKMKMANPLAKHVPVILSALLVPQVVHIPQLLVLLELMPVAQHRVIHVPVVLTALLVHPVVRILQLLVLLEPMPVVQHRVIHVVLGNTTSKSGNQVVNRVVKASTILTTIKLDNPPNPLPVKIAAPASTTTKQDYPLAKHAAPANTTPTTTK